MKQKTKTQGRGYESPSLSALDILNEAGFCDSYGNQKFTTDDSWTWDDYNVESQNN